MNANATSNLSLSARDDLSGYLLTGPASAEALAGSGLPQPQSQLTALEMTGALVARTAFAHAFRHGLLAATAHAGEQACVDFIAVAQR